MSQTPAQPKIYHITHIDNFPAIIASGGLLSDAVIIQRGGPAAQIGMSQIKQRRLTLPVVCHQGICVGECVPFYFCPRSVMLYVLNMGNLPGVTYQGGQQPIVHLEADLHAVVAWANAHGRLWAFSTSNAGARYTNFYADLAGLNQINWAAIGNNVFRDSAVKEPKQSEFLIHESFPWDLVERIGVISQGRQADVNGVITVSQHRPPVDVKRDWYF